MNGVINVYKEAGVTSFNVVSQIRTILKVSKCGHLGTLDPMAEGILPVCIGYATRFSDYLSSVNKEYIAEFMLGVKSDSYDNTSDLKKVSDIIPTTGDIENVLLSLIGKISLKVPAFSAKKINGVRAYKLARKGVLEDAGARDMDIYSITLLNYNYPLGVIKVVCGKGTYIRSIINTMGENLGCGAVMSGLVRSANGIFSIKTSYKISDIEKMVKDGSIVEAVVPVYKILDWGRAIVKDTEIKHIQNGNSLKYSSYISLPIEHIGDNFFIMDNQNNLLAVAERVENSSFPLKLKMVLIK